MLISMIRSVLFLFLLKAWALGEDPVVQTPLGSILGIVQISRKGIYYYSFRGIPYAKAPIDELRFKPPQPVEPWDKIFNGTEDGPVCYMPITKNYQDCLRLNIYTRRINDQSNNRPVLVFIHGGDFNYLSGRSEFYGPDYLMDHDIVVVTINYRLGALGFFSTGDKYAPGNYGLKDQVQALEWVKNNIKFFGGDANKVTISGENAGAASVGLHLVSPMSRGLFHGAIMFSGSAINPWVVDKNPLNIAKKLANSFNCSTETTEKLADCITQISADQIEYIYNDFFVRNNTGHSYSPVIEYENDGTEKFLVKDPLISLMEGDIADVPVFIGTARIEKHARVDDLLYDKKLTKDDFSKNWKTILPLFCQYEPNDGISRKLVEFYFKNLDKFTPNDLKDALSDVLSDALVIFGVIRSAKLISEANTKPVYLYQYNRDGRNLHWKFHYLPEPISTSGDLYYIFTSKTYNLRIFNSTSDDGKYVTQFTTLWKNFMETGNPTPNASSDLDDVIWEPYTNENPRYLNINNTLKLVNGLYLKERINLWEKLFPLPEKN